MAVGYDSHTHARTHTGTHAHTHARTHTHTHTHTVTHTRPCRDGWVQGEVPALAEPMAAHAVDVVRAARLYNSTEDAIADLAYVYAATSRSRQG